MIVILAMPQMKTRVAATIYKGSGECGARIFHSASQRDRGEESMMRMGKGKKGGHGTKYSGMRGREEGRRGGVLAARSLTPPLNVFCSPRKNDCPN